MSASKKELWNNRLRQERIRRNWRQQDLADHLGTTILTVQRWERGSHQPSAYFRIKLCALFGKSAEELGFVSDQELPPATEETLSHPCVETKTSPETAPALDVSGETASLSPDSASERHLSDAAPLAQDNVPPAHLSFGHLARRTHVLLSFAWVASLLLVGLTVLLGVNVVLQHGSLFSFLLQHAVGLLVLAAGLILMTFLALLLSTRPPHTQSRWRGSFRASEHRHSFLLLSSTTSVSFVMCFTLLLIILLRPSWCPGNLCLASQVVTSVQGVHDEHLEIYPVALQSTSFVIAGDPATTSEQNLPQHIGAVRIDRPSSSSLYRVVIGVHSLEKEVWSLLIQRVVLVIERVSIPPRPLNVWLKGSPVDYHANPYLARYVGQGKGESLSAIYTPVPYANVQLVPGEADQLDIQIASLWVGDVRFHLQILYRLAQESVVHTLTLPDSYEVVFSDASNWNEYVLQNGHFVPTSRD